MMGAQSLERNENGQTYRLWRLLVDRALMGICGLTSSDLADVDFWLGWESGEDPAEFARAMLTDEGFPDLT